LIDSGAGSFADGSGCGADGSLSRPPDKLWLLSVAGKSGRESGHSDIDAIDPNVWSGRAVQEVSSILAMRSCINVSGL
jgi:hypothetical protein